MLPLLVLLLGSTAAKAQYNPEDPPEPGVIFTLTVRCVPENAAYSLSPTRKCTFGSQAYLNTSPRSGYKFLQWEDEDGTVVSTAAEFDYVMPAKDVTLTARFEYDPVSPEEPSTPEFKNVSIITFVSNPTDAGYFYWQSHGSYYDTCSEEYEVGSTHIFHAYENRNYRFVNWTRGGVVIGTEQDLEYTVPIGDHTLVANYEYNPENPAEPGDERPFRQLLLQTNPVDAASVYFNYYSYYEPQLVKEGDSVNVYAYSNPYYNFVNWTDDEGNVVSETHDFIYTMPDRKVTLTANYTYNYDPTSPEEPGTPNPDGSIAENMVMWPRMGMYDDTHVQILCETPGATIHYTLDGTTPTADSPVYTEPVFVGSNLLVRAIAYKEGMEDSPVVSYRVTAYKTSIPIFTFENRKLTITCDTPDAIIRYTTDYTDPNEESEIYTAPLEPEENCRIKAYASKEGLSDSPINMYVFRRAEHTIPAPTFQLNDDGKLVIVPSVSGGQIWYTTDGSVPTTASTLYTEPLTLDGNYIIKAYTTHINYYDSPIGEYASEGFIVEKPVYSFENPLLTLSTPTEGASIRYTLDGTIPTEESALYNAPIRLTADSRVVAKGFKDLYASSDTVVFNYVYRNFQLPTPTAEFGNKHLTLSCEKAGARIYYAAGDTLSMPEYSLYENPVALTEDCTVRFYASLEHFNDSEVGSFDFKVANYQVAAPVLTYDPANLTVTMTCETENAEIRYTRDGSIPTATTGIVYDGPAQVVCNQTFTAVAFRSDLFASEPASVVVDDQKVPTPTASFGNKVLTLACANPEAQIRYTIDGTEPSAQSTLYSGPVALNADCTVLFYASCQDFNDSEVASFEFKVANYQVGAPVLTYDPEALTVTMTSATEDAEIRYTVDGEAPTESTGTKYEGPIAVVGNHTYTAKAFRSDLFASASASVTVDDQKVKTPASSYEAKLLTLSCPDELATIHYTTDGSTPTAASAAYSEPLPMSADCTVKFIAVRESFLDSDPAEYVFRVADHQVAAPVMNYDREALTVTIACASAGSEIRYTIDGEVPTATTGTVYTAPIPVVGNHVYQARAFRADLFDSAPASVTVADQKVKTPASSYDAKLLTLSCPDELATIHYTTDGSAPTAASAAYSEPLPMSADCTVKFIAVRESFLDSDPAEYVFRVADHQVAAPVMNYDREALTVTIACASEGSEIRYTIDGEVPTATTGTVYTAPIPVVGNHIYQARAFRADLFDSAPASVTVDDQKVKTPASSYEAKLLTLSCPDELATIHYTTDGSAPTAASAAYSEPLPMSADCTVKFIAVREFFLNSDVATYEFKVSDHQVATPVLTYNKEAKTVTMACAADNAEIRYTVDGEAPTESTGTKYEGPIAVVGNHTYTAKAFRSDLFASDAASVTVDDQKVPTPTASYEAKRLTLSCSDADAAIHYTTDGSAPTAASAVYSAPLPMSADCTVKFIAVREFFLNSDVATYEFKVSDHKVATPVLTYNKEAKTVTMACAADNAEIRYTVDGEAPTESTGTKYEGPIAVVGNHTYTAKAFRSDLFASDATSLAVDDQKVPTPTASFANRVLTLSCQDANARIRYTLDGTDPTSASTLYTAPVALTQDCTVKIIAQREYFIDSEVATFNFKVAEHQVAIPGFGYDAQTSMLTISCATANAEIRYTSDGSDPTATTGIKYEGPIKVEGNSTYKARAFRSDLLDSKIASLVINDQSVATPTASFSNKLLTLSCEDSHASIRYTLDGTTPTSQSALYTAPLALTQDCTVKFIAQRENFNDSEVVAFQFKVADYQVAKPVFAYNTEGGSVTITCGTENAEIRYALDGSVPTLTTGTKYAGAIAVVGNFTITAKAFRSDLFDSETALLEVSDKQVPTPTASFANKQLTLACADSQATIYYTTDGTDPTTSSSVYEAPLALTKNCTVKFFATRKNYNDSQMGTFEFEVENYMVATPVLTYNPKDSSISISCATENAEIRYTTDGSEPTATNGSLYTAPVTYYGNVTFNARAFRNGLFDSEVASLVISGQKVPTPTASFAKKQLTLECTDANAQIHYTLDGSAPTSQSTLYSGPVALTANCTVRFIASREHFNDSEEATFVFNLADYQVAAPVITHSLETLKVTMTCATAGASIRYTTDGTVPTATTGTLYAAPVDLNGNVTYTARAFHGDYFDSNTTVYTVSDMKLPIPKASYSRHAVTIECEDKSASIRYTTDGSEPTASSTLYSGPIPVSADCTVRFFATKTGYIDSDEGSYRFVLADYREPAPSFKPDFADRTLSIDNSQSLPVKVTINGLIFGSSEETMEVPATVKVDQDMASVSAVALAQDPDRYDSEAVSYDVVFHQPPVFDDYYGHTLAVNVAENEPAADNVVIRLYVDGKLDVVGSSDGIMTEIADFCNVQAYVESDHAFVSDVTEKRIDFFNTGSIAGARNGHRLAEAIGTWGDSKDDYTYIKVKGELNRADMLTIAELGQLTALHIDSDLADDDFSNVFADTRIETLCSKAFPKGMISGMPRLTTLIWGEESVPMPEGVVADAGNPNLLIWVSDEAGAPADAVNLVRFPAVDMGSVADPNSGEVTGNAQDILLQYGYPFNAHKPIKAANAEVEKTFSLPTVIDGCAGWETITLPFVPDSVLHERAGKIVPFGLWNSSDLQGPKPYWLYCANGDGWEEATSFEAGIPYIISMPNNKDYVEAFNLTGIVKFVAKDVTLGTDEQAPAITDWKDGDTFVGTFMPVEQQGILSLNVNTSEEGVYRGSEFVANDITLPFGAYVMSPSGRQSIPVFGGSNGVQLPTVTTEGILVETPAPGMIRISSNRTIHSAIFTPEGATVRVIDLQAGETLDVEGLTRGLYICAGVKVMVK